MATKKPLAVLARENGQTEITNDPHAGVGGEVLKAKHRHADIVHGWTYYERVWGEPVELLEEDYRAALDAPADSPHDNANMHPLIAEAMES